jgi:DNA modification methylase
VWFSEFLEREAMKETNFEYRDVDELIPYARNARTHSPEQVQKLAGSIKEFGFINPVIISEDGGVLAGHGRIMAAQKLGIKKVPCVIESHLSEAQRRAYILADNRLALDAGWDEELLKIELEELKGLDFDLELTGFDAEELKGLMGNEEELSDGSEGGDEDEEEEVKVEEEGESIVQPGDVWLLGDHRFVCGDSTDKEVVRRVMRDDKPNLMVTDPPYGVNFDPKNYDQVKNVRRFAAGRAGKVFNDNNADWVESYKLFPGNIAYIWHGPTKSDVVMQGIKSCGFDITSMIVWNKMRIIPGFSNYNWQHETCVYATKGKHNWQGSTNESTVWDIKQVRSLNEGEWGHSTQKPIECMRRPIENNSCEGEYVYDPFLGSGTTIIAAERSGRKCLGCELSPHYCDAIIQRWEEETGRQAIRESDGVLFDDLALSRMEE